MEENGQYHNRDLSWLSFNYRVLQEAADTSVPLYERLKFLAIFSSNLDEFYRVRVASHQRLLALGKKKQKKLHLTPAEVLDRIHQTVDTQQAEFGEIYEGKLLPALKKEGIALLNENELTEEQKETARNWFYAEVFPVLQPIVLNAKSKLPFLKDKGLYLVVELSSKSEAAQEATLGLVEIPSDQLPRFVELGKEKGTHSYIFLDDLLRLLLPELFPSFRTGNAYAIKMSRDADLYIDDEFEGDLVEKIKRGIEKRESGVPSRLLYDQAMPGELVDRVVKMIGLNENGLVLGARYHNFSDFFSFPNPLAPKLENPALPPLPHSKLDKAESIFKEVAKKDFVLHFPYQSYDNVIRFLNEAATDPKVTSVKVTQYRVAANSAVANALIAAARNGKRVTVFVEIKARFDEALNLKWAGELEAVGAKIVYSIPGLKVHAKIALVTRKAGGKTQRFAFLSTGNFNEKTSRIYADHGLFTSDAKITRELQKVFSFLEDREDKLKFHALLVAQFGMQEAFEKKIKREISHAKKGKPAHLILKMNGLEDKDMINALYKASAAGVKIDLIVRGICRLVPGVEGLSENITLRRLVDRYLEHARIYYFQNNGKSEMYLSSADWMGRNLKRRIEVGFPIQDQKIKKEILHCLELQLTDNTKAKLLDSELNHLEIKSRGKPVRAQLDFYRWLESRQ